MKMNKMLLSLCFVGLLSSQLLAATPLKLSLFSDIALFNSDTVSGLDLGILTTTKQNNGEQLGFIYASSESLSGTQVAYIWANAQKIDGYQFAIVSTSGKVQGMQFGLVSIANEINGLQFGFYSSAKKINGYQYGTITINNGLKGTQGGFLNISTGAALEGFQVGMINYADDIKCGFQLGLLNIIKNSTLPAMVFLNAKF